jgi:predicted nucleic acid-binding protein
MSGDFIDSNVVVYSLEDVDFRKRGIAARLIDDALEYGHGWISYQVVQEVLNTALRKFGRPLVSSAAGRLLDDVLMPLCRVMPSQSLYELGLDVQERYRYTFYDSLIIAAALSSDCDRLYSEDLQPGQRIEGLTIVNPFA